MSLHAAFVLERKDGGAKAAGRELEIFIKKARLRFALVLWDRRRGHVRAKNQWQNPGNFAMPSLLLFFLLFFSLLHTLFTHG